MSLRTPSYRLHKPTGQAVVTLNGRDLYLGKHGSTVSRSEYDRLISEWLASGRQLDATADATVSELMVNYIHHVESYYVKDGSPTSEAGLIKLSLRVLKKAYGHTPAMKFGPLALKAMRQAYVEAGLCRTEVNRRTGHVVRFFRWAVENELVPPSVHHGLSAVSGLRKGRSDVRESKPVRPVPDAFVDAVRPHVSPQVRAMIDLQRLTGMRPGEVTIMRSMDLDTSGAIWEYTPDRHKTEHHGRERKIPIGSRGQAILREWLRPNLEAYLFSPAEAEAARLAELRRTRKTPVQPSQRDRRKPAQGRKLADRYTVCAYHHAILHGCRRAFPHPEISAIKRKDRSPEQWAELKVWDREHAWHPNQLRHNAATRLRKEFGLDVARVILGHSSPAVTEVYAEVDRAKALKVMEQVG